MPSHSSTLVREDHSACVSLSPGFPKLLYHPPDLQYPSCYHDEMEEGKMGFPLPTIVTGSRSQRVIPRPAVSVALGKLLAKQIFRSHPRPAESETLMGPHITLKKFIYYKFLPKLFFFFDFGRTYKISILITFKCTIQWH